jgi:hypothetical protein
MAGDDIFWKNVEAMKQQSPAPTQKAPTRQNSGQKRTSSRAQVSPSYGAAGGSMSALPPVPADIVEEDGGFDAEQGNHQYAAVRPSNRSPVRPFGQLRQVPARPAQRRPERYAFQFWADQITRLKMLRHTLNAAMDPEDRMEITLSDLVREAMDEYLDRQTRPVAPTARPAAQAVRTAVRPSP